MKNYETKKDYEVKIRYTSIELSAKDRVKLKDTRNAIKLDEVVQPDKPLLITPDFYGILDVHNENAKDGDNKDFEQFVVVDKGGNKYVTGSNSFMDAFIDILDEMSEADEDYEIEIYKLESKNYKGKSFITCSIA